MSTTNLIDSVITILEAKTKTINTKVKIQGIVTYAKDKIFIQDHTSGISLYKQSSGDNFCEGDFIEVRGKITLSKNLIEIKKYTVKKIPSKNPLPMPKDITIKDIMNADNNKYQAMLIRLRNVKLKNGAPSFPLEIMDSKGEKLYIYPNCPFPIVTTEDWIDITGILNYGSKKYQLYIKSSEDIVKNHPQILFKYLPGNMTSTFNKVHKISAFLEKGSSFLNFSSAKLYIDNKEVSSIIDKNSISYLPTENLSYGVHDCKVSLYDIKDNIYEFQWYFFIEKKNINYNFYYGVPHCHTSFSDGKGTPTEACTQAKNLKLDFLFITDHSGSLNSSEINNKVSTWETTKAEAQKLNSEYKDFLAIAGFEVSTKLFGHVNVINCKNLIDKKLRKNPEKLYQWLRNEDIENMVLSINHPNRLSYFLPHINEFNKFISLMEVGHGSPPREYTRLEEYYYKALDNGWYVGAINGQDNHSDNWGETDNLTVVIAETLDIKSFINALKSRRVYSTETRTLKLTVKANNHWMGSIINLRKSDKINLQIVAEDPSIPISNIQVISNGGIILEERDFSNSTKAKWELTLENNSNYSWYVVKVIHEDGSLGIASPIFLQTY